MKRAPVAALLCLVMAAGCAPRRSLVVSVGGTGTADAPCFVEVEGERLPMDRFAALARRWRGREAHLRGESDTPYRCVGPVIYNLQRARIGRIGFISEPAAAPEANQ